MIPLHQMCLSGRFEWNSVHRQAWLAIKLLASLNFENCVIDENRTLILACDSSQISVSWIMFQVIDGEIKLIGADRRKAAAFRECIALLFCLMTNEHSIKAHPSKVLILTDCIGLSQIFRSKDSSSKLMEAALYLSSFNNLHVKYSTGTSLLTRQYNRAPRRGSRQDQRRLGGFKPPLSKKHLGAELTPEMITDLLCASPESKYIDCFAKRKFYSQALNRYHTSDDSVMTCTDPIPVELEFLSSVYGGWNAAKMTKQQFQELNNSIKNLPAQQLARKLGNTNLNALRKSLYELDLHADLLSVLGRKYFPEKWHNKHELSVSEFMQEQDLPQQIAGVVREALHEAGTPTTTRITKLV